MSPPSLTAAGEPARPTIIVGAFSAGSVSSPAPVSDRDHDLRRSRRLTSRAVTAAQGRTGWNSAAEILRKSTVSVPSG